MSVIYLDIIINNHYSIIMKDEEKNIPDNEIVFEELSDDAGGIKTDAVKKLREKLKQCTEERQEYLDGWQRMKADSINARKEEEKKRSEIAGFVKEDTLHRLLPALDSFELAFKNKESWERVDANWRKGVEYIYSQVMGALKEIGLEEINSEGVMFDPRVHVSVETATTDEKTQEGMVAQTFQKGYKIGESVIRPARVVLFEYKEGSNGE